MRVRLVPPRLVRLVGGETVATPAGLDELTGIVHSHQREVARRSRLVLEAGPAVLRVLSLMSPGADWLPPPDIPETGTGLAYRQVHMAAGPPALGDNGWRLLEDGEVVSEGTVG